MNISRENEITRLRQNAGQCFHAYINARIRGEPDGMVIRLREEWLEAYNDLMRTLDTLANGKGDKT